MKCSCINITHDHRVGACGRRPTVMYGICSECRYFKMGEPPK